ncbi:MAG: tail fiber domain-containing protein [Bacteroidota bacterium]
MKKIIVFICLLGISFNSFSQLQWRKGGNSVAGGANSSIGTNNSWNAPLYFITNGITRMQINDNNGATAGFIGVGTNAPNSPMSIVGDEQLNAQGWKRAISITNSGGLIWENGGGNSFFMAHPSSTPNGNWYAGAQNGIGSGAVVDYSMTVYANNSYGTVNPLQSTQIYKNLLVYEPTFGRRFGVNTWNPQLAAEVYSNNNQLRLSWGPTVSTNGPSGVFTDFFTNNFGNLQIMPTGQRVGINLNANPTANLDVNGDARIRNVQAAVPNSIIVGVNANGASDVNVRRLDFTGNANQVLLGNGTWGNAQPIIAANNGIISNGNTLQLGAACNNLGQLLITAFTGSRAQYLNGNSYWMFSTANQAGGVGFGAQPASSGLCGVGNTVEISANNQSAYGNTNASGLRFTKLTSASPTIANGTNGVNNTKILTVDANGDVVLTNGIAGPQGPIGLTGATGPQGPQGIPGTNANLQANNGNSVSATGLVVLGQDYQELGDPAQMLNNREIPMRGKNILYTDEGRIGIGDEFSNPLSSPLAKVDIRPSLIDQKGFVVANTLNFATVPIYEMNSIYNATTGTSEMYGQGIYMAGSSVKRSTGLKIQNTTQTGSAFGIESEVNVNGNVHNTAGRFGAHGVGDGNTAVSGSASGSMNGNTAGSFRAGNPTGVGLNGLLNIGVNAWSISGTTSIGIMASATGGTTNNYAAHFTGDVYANGNILSTSDINLKENVSQLANADQILNDLNPVTFDYKQNGIYQRMHMPQNLQYGLIAQEVETILPTLIKDGHFPAEYDSLGNVVAAAIEFKTMNYEGLIPILVKAHQEQGTQIDSLQTANEDLQEQVTDLNDRLTQLENCLSGILPFLCQMNQSAIQSTPEEMQEKIAHEINVTLSNRNNIILNQNVPNPFAESTVITYSIPSTVGKAQIHFYDGQGKLINSVDINERGNGSLNVFANDLSTGVYTYSLVADGQIVATKRMVKQ